MEVWSDPKNVTTLEVDRWVWDNRLFLAEFAAGSRHLYPGRRATLVVWDNDREFRTLDYVGAFEAIRRGAPHLARSGKLYREEWAQEVPKMDPDRTILVVVQSDPVTSFGSNHYRITMGEGQTLDHVLEAGDKLMDSLQPEAAAKVRQIGLRLAEENQAKGERAKAKRKWWQ